VQQRELPPSKKSTSLPLSQFANPLISDDLAAQHHNPTHNFTLTTLYSSSNTPTGAPITLDPTTTTLDPRSSGTAANSKKTSTFTKTVTLKSSSGTKSVGATSATEISEMQTGGSSAAAVVRIGGVVAALVAAVMAF
jgi:hypothetical protein